MTNYYTIHVLTSNVKMKIGYRNGKFFKLEKISGKLSIKQHDQIGIILPKLEKEIQDYQVKWKGKVSYIKVNQKKTLYTLFLEAWFNFYNDLMGIKPSHNAAEGKHLKKIIKYIKSIEPVDDDALKLWEVILTNWNRLESFYRNNADLKFISSQINKIFQNVKRINEEGAANVNADYLRTIKRDLQS